MNLDPWYEKLKVFFKLLNFCEVLKDCHRQNLLICLFFDQKPSEELIPSEEESGYFCVAHVIFKQINCTNTLCVG